MNFISLLTDLKDIISPIAGLITGLVTLIKLFFGTRSKTTEIVLDGHKQMTTMMSGEDRAKIDAERLRAFAEYTKTITPFVAIEYLYFFTKVTATSVLIVYLTSKVDQRQN